MSTETVVRFCAPTLAGIKVANLFNTKFSSVKELLGELMAYNKILNPKGIYIVILRLRESSALILVYRKTILNKILANKEIQDFLINYGYFEFDMLTASDFSSGLVANYEGFAFGCPSMGNEVLEEDEFQPMWDEVSGGLDGKKVVLFGSYGWGDGEWMRTWEEESPSAILGTCICNEAPDPSAQTELVALADLLI